MYRYLAAEFSEDHWEESLVRTIGRKIRKLLSVCRSSALKFSLPLGPLLAENETKNH